MTAQIHENLILEGQKTSMAFCPPIPDGHPRIKSLTSDEVNAGIQDGRFSPFIFSTACWRQYIGTWEIRDGLFYLVEIDGIYKLIGAEPLFAEWFTGTLRIPKGDMLHYVHMGFGSVFENELHIKIENGRVVTSRTIDNKNKDIDRWELGLRNLPGGENHFDGDDEL